MKKINYGILSTASIVPRFVKGMRLTGTGEVIAIASRSMQKAEQNASELNIPHAYESIYDLLSNPEVDAVYIPVINVLHYEYAEAALKAGKHVLMEKPFVLHSWQARALRELAREKNLFLTEAVKAPHLPVYAEIRKIISSQELGKLHFMEFRQSYNSGPYITGWNVDKACGGGVLYGNEAYYLAIAQLLAGPIRSIDGSAVFPGEEAESQISISAVHPDGIISELCVSRIVLFDNGLKMYFENGRIEVPSFWKADKAYVIQNGEHIRTIDIPCESEMTYELKHYNECILSGRLESPITSLDMTIRNTELVESLYQRWEALAESVNSHS